MPKWYICEIFAVSSQQKFPNFRKLYFGEEGSTSTEVLDLLTHARVVKWVIIGLDIGVVSIFRQDHTNIYIYLIEFRQNWDVFNQENYERMDHLPNCLQDVLEFTTFCSTWWRHQMETLSALLALCPVNSPFTDEFPTLRPVTQSIDAFFDLRLNEWLNKRSWGWWFEMPSCSLWRLLLLSRGLKFFSSLFASTIFVSSSFTHHFVSFQCSWPSPELFTTICPSKSLTWTGVYHNTLQSWRWWTSLVPPWALQSNVAGDSQGSNDISLLGSGYGPSHWEMALQCYVVSHWLIPYL